MKSALLNIIVFTALSTVTVSAERRIDLGYETGLEDDGFNSIHPDFITIREAESNRCEASTSYARSGNYSLRSELNYGDTTEVGIRTECANHYYNTNQTLYSLNVDEVHYYGFSILLDPVPGNHDYDDTGEVLIQEKQGGGVAYFQLLSKRGKFSIITNNNTDGNKIRTYLDPYELGVWYDFVLEVLPTTQSNGFINVYMKKAYETTYANVHSYSGSTLPDSTHNLYLKWGMYKATWTSPSLTTRRVVYHDNVRVGTTFADADPASGDDPVVTVALDDFQSNTWSGGTGWNGDWVVTTGNDFPEIVLMSGNYSVEIHRGENNHSITRTLASGVSGGTLGFKWDVDSLDSASEYGYAEVFDGTWHTVWSMNNSGVGIDANASPDNLQEAVVDLSTYGTVTQVRFSMSNNTQGGDYFYVDDVEFRAVVDAYQVWSDGYGLAGTNALMGANPDGDALNNLAEYALGGSPTNGTVAAGILPSMGAVNGSVLEYIHRRRTNHVELGLSYWVERNTNLVSGTWTTNGVSISGTAPAETGFETVTNEISTSAEDEQFVRLKIESL